MSFKPISEAVRTGNMLAGDGDKTLNEIFPQNYAAQAEAPSKTRAQVIVELKASRIMPARAAILPAREAATQFYI